MRQIAALVLLAASLEAASWKTQFAEANRLNESGQSAAAERVYQQVVSESEGYSASDLNAAAGEFVSLARYREAELLYRKALAAWERMGPAGDQSRITTAGNLGVVLRTETRYSEAERLLLDCLKQAESLFGPETHEVAHAASNLAALYMVWGMPAKGQPYAVRAETIFGAHQEGRTSDRLNNWRVLASIYLAQGQFEEAKTRLKDILAGEEDRLTPGAYNEMAVIALRQNQPAEAESLARRALEIAARRLPAAHPDRAAILNNLAQACRFQGRYEDAERYYRDAIAAWSESVGSGHPDTAKGYLNLAGFYHERGREAGAEQLYGRAAEIFAAVYGENHPLTLVARNELAEVLRAEGRFTESDKLSRTTLAALERSLPSTDARVIHARANRARLLASVSPGQKTKVDGTPAVSNSLR